MRVQGNKEQHRETTRKASKSLRIRNRPDTAPTTGARNQRSGIGVTGTKTKVDRNRRTAWGEKDGSGRKTSKGDIKMEGQAADGVGRSSSSAEKEERRSTSRRNSREADQPQEFEEPSSTNEQVKKTFLKRKRQKIKMYKIPNYSHVKPLVDSRHFEDQDEASELYMTYTRARPASAPPPASQEKTPSGSMTQQQVDSPIDDLKDILGLKHSQGKENALPRSSARKGRRRKGKFVNTSTHLNISGTVSRLFSSSVQKAKQSILLFDQSDMDGEGETSQVPRALQKFEENKKDMPTGSKDGNTEAGSASAQGKRDLPQRLRNLLDHPELVEKIKAETRNLEDFVKPRELSFVHSNMIHKQ